jgi:hypothetical protein
MRRTAFLCLFAPLGIVLACSSDPKKPPPAADGNANGGAGAGGLSNEGGVSEGGVDGGDGGVCTVLDNTGVLVPRLGITGDPPVQTGGTISDGTYDLKETDIYVGTGVGGPTGDDWQESIRITGNVLERVRLIKDGNTNKSSETRSTFNFAASQSSFALAEACPLNTAALPDQYTATDVQITIVETLTKEVFVYQKH